MLAPSWSVIDRGRGLCRCSGFGTSRRISARTDGVIQHGALYLAAPRRIGHSWPTSDQMRSRAPQANIKPKSAGIALDSVRPTKVGQQLVEVGPMWGATSTELDTMMVALAHRIDQSGVTSIRFGPTSIGSWRRTEHDPWQSWPPGVGGVTVSGKPSLADTAHEAAGETSLLSHTQSASRSGRRWTAT